MFSKKADDTSLMPFLLFTIIWSNSTVKDRLRAEAIIQGFKKQISISKFNICGEGFLS